MPAHRRAPARAALLLTLASLLLLGAPDARADIYKYETEDGQLLITDRPQRGLKLIEVIRTGDSPRPSTPARPPAARSDNRSRRSAGSNASAASRTSAYDHLIREAADAYGLPFAFVKAVVRVESNFNPQAVSRVGAMGLMQLMPGTAEELGVTDPFDPRQNVFGGTKYLRMLTNRYNGDINLVLAGYNAGPGNVDRFSGIPFASTQGYVRDVYRWYQHYKAQHGEQTQAAAAAAP